MSLPVTPEYLSFALQDGCQVGRDTLAHHHIGDLLLPTGQLVACDPFVTPEAPPYKLTLPEGTLPVILSVAQMGTDQRVAFAAVRFRETAPVKWKMVTSGNVDPATLEPGHILGYGVDSGTGCFMDRSAGLALTQKMKEEPEFSHTMIAEMEKTYRHTWSWLNIKFADGNVIAFSSGFGDGLYATYAGFDSHGEVAVVVTDFMVVPFDEEPSAPKQGWMARFAHFLLRKIQRR
jgi:hypothetical protein